MGWVRLAVAILLEVAGTTEMKVSEGSTRVTPSVLLFVCFGFAITALIAVIAILFFAKAITPWSLICFAPVIVGAVGPNPGSAAHHN